MWTPSTEDISTAAQRAVDERIAQMTPLTARQFRLGLLAHGLLAQVDEAVAALDEPQRSAAEIEWEYATSFDRHHPLVSALASHIGLDDEQIDEMWLEAKGL